MKYIFHIVSQSKLKVIWVKKYSRAVQNVKIQIIGYTCIWKYFGME